MSSTDLPDYYYQPGKPRPTWASNADETWRQEHGFDEFGNLTGPLGPVPAGAGMGAQEAHNQSVFRARSRLGQSASAWAQGSLGLLQSFRPGGGAAIEANAYGQLAQIDLQRASMLQPMDLLGDYRRDQAHKARVQRKKAATTQAITTGVGAILTAIPGVGAVLGPAVMSLGAPLGQAMYPDRDPSGGARAQSQGSGWGPALGQGLSALASTIGAGQAQQGQQPQTGTEFAFGSNSTGWQQAPAQGGQGGVQGSPQGQAQQSRMGGESAGQPQTQGPQTGPGQSGGKSIGPSVGAAPSVGLDGVFNPTSYARDAAYEAQTSLPGFQGMMRQVVVQNLMDDSFWDDYSASVDRQIESRGWYGGWQP